MEFKLSFSVLRRLMVIAKAVNCFFGFSCELATKDSNNFVTFSAKRRQLSFPFRYRTQPRNAKECDRAWYFRRRLAVPGSLFKISIFDQQTLASKDVSLRAERQP